jgi:hypothetical protein
VGTSCLGESVRRYHVTEYRTTTAVTGLGLYVASVNTEFIRA